jgi:hypothetical protein
MTNYCIASTWLTLVSTAGLVYAAAPTPSVATHTDCTTVSTPSQKEDEDTIRRIEHDWLTAEYRGNPQFLECLLEPDYRTSGRTGKVRSRADVIGHVPQTTDFTREVPQLETIAFVHGDAATAHSIMHTTDKAGNPKEVHFVDAYTFHDGRWHAYSGADL